MPHEQIIPPSEQPFVPNQADIKKEKLIVPQSIIDLAEEWNTSLKESSDRIHKIVELRYGNNGYETNQLKGFIYALDIPKPQIMEIAGYIDIVSLTDLTKRGISPDEILKMMDISPEYASSDSKTLLSVAFKAKESFEQQTEAQH